MLGAGGEGDANPLDIPERLRKTVEKDVFLDGVFPHGAPLTVLLQQDFDLLGQLGLPLEKRIFLSF